MTPTAVELDVFSCPLDGIALIEASAGTGKTWNICGLYLRQLLERNLPVSRLLVVTFTRAATAELSARIRARILAALRALDGVLSEDDPFIARLLDSARAAGANDGDIRGRLQGALAAFDEAAIFTIHSFCQRALADAPFSAGLPYTLEVGADDSELRLEVTHDFWRHEIATASPTLADYLLASKDSPENWAQWLKNAQARPLAKALWDDDILIPPVRAAGCRPYENTATCVGAATCRPPDTNTAECEATAACEAAYRKARQHWNGGDAPRQAIIDALPGLNKKSYTPETIERAFRQWSAWLASNDPGTSEQNDKLALFSATTLADKTNKGRTTPEHPFFDAAQALLDARKRLDQALETARRQLLRRFIEQAGAELRQRKRIERRLSFDDILWNAHEALVSGRQPWLASALHARYPVALIDEFQDTDPLQLAIFQSIYASGGRHGSLFLVGDPKQAIYSFRGADLHTYLGARGLADAHYTLAVNRRSAPALVAACNRLFSANPAVFMETGLDFRPARAAGPPHDLVDKTSSGDEPAALRLWLIPRDSDENADDGSERLLRAPAMARTADASAAEIARLLAAGRRGDIHIGPRPLQPADLAVLVRSHREGGIMRRALAVKGVGSIELSQSSVFASLEAEELERILAAVAAPPRERPLKTALATSLMGWDAAALARLADDADALVRQFERFANWHEDWLRHGFAVMLWRWMADDGVAARLLVRDDGERRLTNLLHLAELLQQEAGKASPAILLDLFARHRSEGGGGDDALLRLESDRNLVQIVTIHRSKGLQYGIVFCPFLFDAFQANHRDDGPMRLWHDDTGAQVADWRHSAANDSAIKECLAKERDAEDLRLIYVALTRAAHRCYLVAGAYAKKTGKNVSYKESARSLLNWMAAGADKTPADWHKSECSPAEIDAHWHALAAGSQGTLAVGELPTGEGEPLPLDAHPPGFSAPRAPKIPNGWRLGSFSALVSGAEHEDAARDHDARVDTFTATGETTPIAQEDDDILRFPRGAAAGDCIHALFESIDFTRHDTRAAAIERALATHPPAADTAQAPLFPRMLANMADDVLATPLLAQSDHPSGGTLRLETVSTSRRLTELGFYLPSPRLSADALNRWLAAHHYEVPRLASRDLSGYLKGYIDLVFEHAGRYWVLDWKSNHLGDTPTAYAPPALATAMAGHGYHLQHLLYTVALHRHLGRTLPGYDYERHFGGVLYLFVRGIRPGWQFDGTPAGVFRHRAPKATIESLDALLAGRSGRQVAAPTRSE